jgi:hypothetical protein
MNKRLFTVKLIPALTMLLALCMTCDVFAGEKYLVKAQFYHLGELIGKPMLEVEEGQTTAGEFSEAGRAQYKIVVLVRPVADGQVYVSMQFSSGKLDIQPNVMADIGKPRSATIKKVRMNLLVEAVGEDEHQATDLQTQALTQNSETSFPQ